MPYNRDEFYKQTTLKLAGAVHGKAEAYRRYRDEPHVSGRPFLLCLSPFDNPWFIMQRARAMFRVLYQYDQPIGRISESGALIETDHLRITDVQKETGRIIPPGYFLDQANADISGIYFNPRATISKRLTDPKRPCHESDTVISVWHTKSTGQLTIESLQASQHRETLADGGYLFLNPFTQSPLDPEAYFNPGITI